MKIEKNKYVSIHYTLTDKDGKVLDSSKGKEPLGYVHGNGYLISGLEKELEGKEPGAEFKCVIEPKDAYGERDPRLVIQVPRSQFEEGFPIEVGMNFQGTTPDGQVMLVRVTEVGDDKVTVDGNHELAGVQLTFDVKVVEVRDATEEELNPPSCGCGCGGNCGGNCEGGCGEGGCGNCGK